MAVRLRSARIVSDVLKLSDSRPYAMTASNDLAALLCSRMCHDLLSPVGAINNGLELLAEETEPEMRQNCLDLIGQSARTSTNKLQFFRLAYGAAEGAGEKVPSEEARELLAALVSENKRLALDWAVEERELAKPAARILLNLAALGIAALVRGGTLLVGAETCDGMTEIVVRAAGPRIAFDPAIGRALEGELAEDELSPRTAPAHLIRLLATELGGSLQHMQSDEALVMGAALPQAEIQA